MVVMMKTRDKDLAIVLTLLEHIPRHKTGCFFAVKVWLRLFFCLVLILPFNFCAYSQNVPATDTLEVVNWNIEWFGDSTVHNPTVQANGVRGIMEAVNADVYAFCEVVDVDTFAAMIQALPEPYDFLVSTYGSFAPDTNSGNYPGAQKLALVYRRGMLRNIKTRAMLSSSVTAYVNFSSGRFPFEVAGEVLGKDSAWRQLSFIVLHAKAFSDANSCARRIDGCRELKDTLDRYYASSSFLLLGDFNDDLDVSNCSSLPQSNYWYMIRDSLHYVPLTLDISRAGAFSSDGYSSLIDQVVASDEVAKYYVPNSAEVLRSLVKSIDPNYGYNISDHFPIRTRYVLCEQVSSIANKGISTQLYVYPNPASSILVLKGGKSQWKCFLVYDMHGRLMLQSPVMSEGRIDVSRLGDGLYLLRAESATGTRAHAMFRVAQ
jgi:trimeric autotransporter adhesin